MLLYVHIPCSPTKLNVSDSFSVTEEFILRLHRENQDKTRNNKLHTWAAVHTCFPCYSIILHILAELANENKNVLQTEEVIIRDMQPAAEMDVWEGPSHPQTICSSDAPNVALP